MKNKLMFSVELRALLERVVKGAPGSTWAALDDDRLAATEELRALLDKPAYPNRLCHVDKYTHPYICGCFKGDDEAQRRFDEHHVKAAQHQGEPVAWIKPDVAKTLTKDECCYAFGSQNPKGTLIPLYAEQPAPVAVGDDQEFSLCWFEASQQWVVIFPSSKTLTGKFGSMGYAEGAALEYLGLGEADFEVTEDNGSFYRYERDSEAEQ